MDLIAGNCFVCIDKTTGNDSCYYYAIRNMILALEMWFLKVSKVFKSELALIQ